MKYQTISVAKLTSALGAEITGVDLKKPMTAAIRDEIQHALDEHLVVFFRDQDISVEDHVRFALAFGEIYTHPVHQPLKDEGRPEVFELASGPDAPFVAERWHSDVTFEPIPPKASILRAVEVPEAAGDTMWASMAAAWEGLSDRMQRMLSGLEAVHVPGYFYEAADAEQRKRFDDRGDVVHPVVRTHPRTGRKGLFVNTTFTSHLVGMKPRESESLLGFLYEHIDSPEYHCRFRWTPDAVAMWDNRITQHRVVADDPAARRVMQRLTLVGEVPT